MHVWSSLVVIYSGFTAFSGFGKRPKVEWSFSCGLNHYLRETLQRGWGTWRYVTYCKLYLRHSLEGVRTKIARIVLRHSAAWRNALRMHSSPKLRSKIQELRRSLVQILDLGSARIPLPIPINILSESKILIRTLVGSLDLGSWFLQRMHSECIPSECRMP